MSRARMGSWLDRFVWPAAGLLAVGVTSSNVIHFGFMELARKLGRRFLPTARLLARAILLAALTLVSSLALTWSIALLRGVRGELHSVAIPTGFIRAFTPSSQEQLAQLARFPEMLGRSLVATAPVAEVDAWAVGHRLNIPFQLTYNRLPLDGMSIALWGLGIAVMGCAVSAYRNGGEWRPLGFGALASLVTFGVVFTLFGLNTFLYSQYWQVPATFLIGSRLVPDDVAGRRRWIPVVALLVVMLAAVGMVLPRIAQRVAASGAP